MNHLNGANPGNSCRSSVLEKGLLIVDLKYSERIEQSCYKVLALLSFGLDQGSGLPNVTKYVRKPPSTTSHARRPPSGAPDIELDEKGFVSVSELSFSVSSIFGTLMLKFDAKPKSVTVMKNFGLSDLIC